MYLLKNKYGVYHFRYTDSNGKQKQVSTGCTDKIGADKFISSYFVSGSNCGSNKINDDSGLKMNESLDGFSNVKKRYKISEFFKMFMDSVNNSKGYYHFNFMIKVFIDFTNDKFIDEVSILDVERFKSFRSNCLSFKNKPYTKTSLNSELRDLRVLFNKAVDYELIKTNPFKKIKYHKVEDVKYKRFTESEIEVLLNGIDNVVLKNIVLFTFYTGCRREEVITLEWSDIDFSSKLIRIQNKDGFSTKNKKNRTIPMNNVKLSDLMLNLYSNRTKSNYVFPKDNGYKFDGDYISKLFKKNIIRLGLSADLCFHAIRHTVITTLLKSGENINKVSKWIGHSSIEMTMKYNDMVIEDVKEVGMCLSF